MKILIAGSNGLLGGSLLKKLSKLGFDIIRISRFKKDDIFFEYHIKDPSIPLTGLKYDAIINCAYCYEEKRIDDHNVNLIINHNLIAFSQKNNIPIFINISSMSAFNRCSSLYGNIKLLIEKEVSLVKGYSFRLGLFEDHHPVGLIAKIYKISELIPFFSFGLKKEYLPQYLTNLDKFSRFLEIFLKNRSIINPGVYSLVNSEPLDFNEIIYAVTKKPPIKIPISILKLTLFIYELFPFPGLRFNLDSLKSLLSPVKEVQNLIKLEQF